MDYEDFYELFLAHLKEEIKDTEYIGGIKDLINQNRFSKANYMKLIKEDET
ncbi:hypothetical protein [Methanobrevibacter sp.]